MRPDASVASPPTRVRMNPDERRARILETAVAFFAESGYDASMGDLAVATGITRPALYHYFPAKADLFVTVVEAQITELMRYAVPAMTGEGSERQRLRATIDALLRFAEERPQSWRILFHHLDQDQPEVAETRATAHETILAALETLLPEEDTQLLGFAPDTVGGQVMGESIIGSITGVVRWWNTHPEVPREEILDMLTEVAWRGLGGIAAAGRRRRRTAVGE